MRRNYTEEQYKIASKKRTVFSALLITIMVPLTFAVAMLLDFRNYMVISLIILLYTLIPFFMVFEKRKPKAREIVMISTISALTVCANLITTYTIPLHAGTALVIISGISLGPEAGFLVGALARFVFNFFLGQGTWTPWEMVAWGVLGFIAGLAFNKVELDSIKSRNFKVIMGPIISIGVAIIAAYVMYIIFGKGDETFWGWRLYAYGAAGLVAGMFLQRKGLPVDNITTVVFTFVTVFIIYGGLMNIAAMVMSNAISHEQYPINLETLKVLYISGAPYDAVHALGASVCVLFFGDNIIRKVERIKIKYGIYK